jgi:hypothetical protein
VTPRSPHLPLLEAEGDLCGVQLRQLRGVLPRPRLRGHQRRCGRRIEGPRRCGVGAQLLQRRPHHAPHLPQHPLQGPGLRCGLRRGCAEPARLLLGPLGPCQQVGPGDEHRHRDLQGHGHGQVLPRHLRAARRRQGSGVWASPWQRSCWQLHRARCPLPAIRYGKRQC